MILKILVFLSWFTWKIINISCRHNGSKTYDTDSGGGGINGVVVVIVAVVAGIECGVMGPTLTKHKNT